MGIQAYLYRDGQVQTGLEDPSGGRFNAAGDFDRLIPAADLEVISRVDPFGDLVLDPSVMPTLVEEVESLLATAHPGAEYRGLLRLRCLAQACAGTAGSTLLFRGD